ncbi:hypothetical protein CK203_038409 [Vitis vinifera]|uniref:Ubiquitin-like protease family profile domain-containing protein n=1 Tax=Vitis vinifera TaxID=29760 RepID=A0A438IRS4_VITVI|nr:hypothetical protein CK203_038409 [Vitis vinifera]
MDSRQRKRRSHVPSRSEAVKLPKSRCSGKKFLSIMDTLPMDKKNAISDMGFGGLQLGCKELRYELITWIVQRGVGHPDNGVDILIYNRRGTPNRTYDIKILEANLRDLPVGEEFMKSFLILPVPLSLPPTQNKKLFYITKFYMTAFQVEVRSPLSAAWTDEQVKRRLAAEIHTYGNYGHVQVIQEANLLHIMMDIHTRRVAHTLMTQLSTAESEFEHLMSLASSVAQDIATLRASDEMMRKGTGAASTHSGQQRVTGCKWVFKKAVAANSLLLPLGGRFKHTAKRLVKPAAICKSPFVSQCVQLFPKISQQERLVADYALSEDGEPSEILCDMHGTYITRDELSSLNGGRWVNSAIIGVVCRMMNAEQAIPPRAHYFDPSFSPYGQGPKSMKSESGVGCSFMLNLWAMISQVVICYFFPSATTTIGTCTWSIFQLQGSKSYLPLPLRRGNGISVVSRRLSNAIDKAFHAHGMLRRLEVSNSSRYDCGMFAIKYMEHWNGATLEHSIAEDKMHLYQLRLVVTLVTNAANNARDKVLKACRI